jgi:hypothetical protein
MFRERQGFIHEAPVFHFTVILTLATYPFAFIFLYYPYQ